MSTETTDRSVAAPARVDFPGTGDVSVAAYRWDPDAQPRAIVQISHGLGEHALRYGRLAQALTDAGYVVYAHDHRGHGATMVEAEPGVIGQEGWQELIADLGRMGKLAKRNHPGLKLVLLGHSMGSFAAQQYLADHSYDVDAAVLSGTAAIDPLMAQLDPDAPLDLTSFNAAFQPARTDFDWLSRDEAEVDKYVADQLCGFGFDAAGTRAMLEGAARLAAPDGLAKMDKELPIYVVVGDKDPVNGELALVDLLVDRYKHAGVDDVTVRVYPDARHEVFNEVNRDVITADLIAWIDAEVDGPNPDEDDAEAGDDV